MPAILVNSLILGLEVACATIALGLASRRFPKFRCLSRVSRLASPGESHLCRRSCKGSASWHYPGWRGWRLRLWPMRGQLHWLAMALGHISTELDRFRNPWIMMSLCVALSLAPRFLDSLAMATRRLLGSGNVSHSARDAARLLGSGPRARAVRLAQRHDDGSLARRRLSGLVSRRDQSGPRPASSSPGSMGEPSRRPSCISPRSGRRPRSGGRTGSVRDREQSGGSRFGLAVIGTAAACP